MNKDALYFSFTGQQKAQPRAVRLGLPSDALSGLRLVFITDIHINRWLTERHLDALMTQIEGLSPDLILWGGDFAETQPLQTLFFERAKKLKPRLGSFAVLGNNDVENASVEQLRAMAKQADIRLLVNESVRVDAGKGSLLILGTDEPKHGTPDPRLLEEPREQEDYRILLTHSPLALRELDKDMPNPPDLILSGHTHGGQISLLGLTPYHVGYELALFGNNFFVTGQHRIGRSLLVVSNGIGDSTLPLRIGAPPELHLIEFEAEKTDTKH